MELGMVGLGRMGANMAERLIRGGHKVTGFDPNAEARKGAGEQGRWLGRFAQGAGRGVAGAARGVADGAVPARSPTTPSMRCTALLAEGDTVIDGGNSNYKDTLRRAEAYAGKQLHYVDCGTSGGVWGLAEGYSMMIGGDEQAVDALTPIFDTLAPGERTRAGVASARSVRGTSPRWSTTASSTA